MLRLSGRQVVVLFLGALGVTLVSALAVVLLMHVLGIRRTDGVAFLALVALVPSLGLLAWTYGWSLSRQRAPDPWLGLGRLSRRWALAGVGAGCLSAAGSWLVVLATRPWLGEPYNAFAQFLTAKGGLSPAMLATALLVGVVLAPLWEELAFRGALYGWLRSRWGIAASALVAAVLHTFLHLDPAVMPALALVFVWFGLLLEWSGNLWVPILAHATNNALALVWVLLSLD